MGFNSGFKGLKLERTKLKIRYVTRLFFQQQVPVDKRILWQSECIHVVLRVQIDGHMKTGYNMSDNVGREKRGKHLRTNIFHTKRYISAHIHCSGNIYCHASLRAKEYQLWHKHTPIISLCDPFSRLSPRMTTKTGRTIKTHIGRSVTLRY
jgi:hypothetical protein